MIGLKCDHEGKHMMVWSKERIYDRCLICNEVLRDDTMVGR